MQLYSLLIEGFRKHLKTKIIFSDSTFLIGENNVGKSSILYALEDGGERRVAVDNIVFTAEFRRIPREANLWRGFKGRLLQYEPDTKDSLDTGLKFIYRKTYPKGGKVKIETLENPKYMKSEFQNCICIQDFLDAGLSEDELTEKR